ncbi:MAG TPA: methyltransferase [Pilimelia sp.]|nr:methyltransferase [Pilimelia sp.]
MTSDGHGGATATKRRTPLDIDAILRLLALGDYLLPYAIRAVCRLEIADRLAGGPLPLDELATRTGTDPASLEKAMRYLATREIFAEPEPGVFALTPLSDLLRRDHPYSARDVYLSPVACTRAMEGLDHAIRTGEAAFDTVHGETMWDYFSRLPHEGALFDNAMSGVTALEMMGIVRAFDWSGASTVVDVGGGNGGFLAALLPRFRHLRGTVFDLPAVVANAEDVLAEAGVADRCDIVPGSFLTDAIPAGADVYVLKRILYSWSDEDATGILRRVRAVMRDDSRLLILEAGRQDDESPALARRMDLLMLTLSAGGTRSLTEQSRLLAGAGLALTRSVTTPMFPVIEARVAAG